MPSTLPGTARQTYRAHRSVHSMTLIRPAWDTAMVSTSCSQVMEMTVLDANKPQIGHFVRCERLLSTFIMFVLGMQVLLSLTTRAVLSPGNRAKPSKSRYVKPVGNFIRKIYRSKEKTRIFDDHTRI